jgi:hypothetical protein
VPPPNKRVVLALALAAWFSGGACGENPAIAIIPVRVELTPATDTVYVGEIATRLTARAFNARDEVIPDADIAWTSDAPSVAAVDGLTGAVTGRLTGVAAVMARAGSVADTATVFVLDPIRLTLPYDTILLAPNDTFTLQLELAVAPGRPAPALRFGGGAPGIVTIDSLTGLITAVTAGTAVIVARADTVVAGGFVAVLELSDTLTGFLHLGLSGALNTSTTMASRSFNHPTEDARTLFQLRAVEGGIHELDVLLIDSLTGPGTRMVETVTPADLGPDPVCLPPASFVFYERTVVSTVTALSLGGGTVTVTSDRPVEGGRIISGRLDVTLQRTDVAGIDGRFRARGTFVVPLVTLGNCP